MTDGDDTKDDTKDAHLQDVRAQVDGLVSDIQTIHERLDSTRRQMSGLIKFTSQTATSLIPLPTSYTAESSSGFERPSTIRQTLGSPGAI